MVDEEAIYSNFLKAATNKLPRIKVVRATRRWIVIANRTKQISFTFQGDIIRTNWSGGPFDFCDSIADPTTIHRLRQLLSNFFGAGD
jgi:hypothetical protein